MSLVTQMVVWGAKVTEVLEVAGSICKTGAMLLVGVLPMVSLTVAEPPVAPAKGFPDRIAS